MQVNEDLWRRVRRIRWRAVCATRSQCAEASRLRRRLNTIHGHVSLAKWGGFWWLNLCYAAS